MMLGSDGLIYKVIWALVDELPPFSGSAVHVGIEKRWRHSDREKEKGALA